MRAEAFLPKIAAIQCRPATALTNCVPTFLVSNQRGLRNDRDGHASFSRETFFTKDFAVTNSSEFDTSRIPLAPSRSE